MLVAVAARPLVAVSCGGDNASATPVTLTLITYDSFAVTTDVLDAVHRRDRHQGRRAAGRGDAGDGGQQGHPHQGQPRGRRAVGRRQHAAVAGARRAALRAVRGAGLAVDRRRLRDARARATSVTPVDYGDVCVNYDKAWFEAHEGIAAADDARRPHQARVQGPARRREPGDVVARPRVPAGHRRPLRDDGWQDYWAGAAGQRREGRRRLGPRPTTTEFSGSVGQGRPSRSSCRTPSSPPAEVVFADPPPTDAADRRR